MTHNRHIKALNIFTMTTYLEIDPTGILHRSFFRLAFIIKMSKLITIFTSFVNIQSRAFPTVVCCIDTKNNNNQMLPLLTSTDKVDETS